MSHGSRDFMNKNEWSPVETLTVVLEVLTELIGSMLSAVSIRGFNSLKLQSEWRESVWGHEEALMYLVGVSWRIANHVEGCGDSPGRWGGVTWPRRRGDWPRGLGGGPLTVTPASGGCWPLILQGRSLLGGRGAEDTPGRGWAMNWLLSGDAGSGLRLATSNVLNPGLLHPQGGRLAPSCPCNLFLWVDSHDGDVPTPKFEFG